MLKLIFTILLFSHLGILPAKASGVVVLAGGGDEGKIGDTKSWSYQLYKKLIDQGDVTGDKKIKVAVVSYYKPSNDEYLRYFNSLGADSAVAVVATSKKEANDPKIIDQIKDADVIFFRGGDQAEYYNLWKDSDLFKTMQNKIKEGASFGGTSAGAMILASHALAGGQELGSKDVLSDGHSPLLDDQNGGSSIHHDFLNVVPNTIIETHFGERARLGRSIGVLAKATEDFKNNNLLSVAISEQTGVVIKDGKAEVIGHGTVEFLQKTPESKIIRKKGEPLVFTDIKNDVLVEGWKYDLKKRSVDLTSIPPTVQKVDGFKKCGVVKSNTEVDGAQKSEEIKFEYSPNYGTDNYSLVQHYEKKVALSRMIGLTLANSYSENASGKSTRALVQSALYRSLYDLPNYSAILLSEDSSLKSIDKNQNLIGFEKSLTSKEPQISSIILDCNQCSMMDLSPRVTGLDNGSQSLRLPALINMRVHVIGNSSKNKIFYDVKKHGIQFGTSVTRMDCTKVLKKDSNRLKDNVEQIVRICDP